MKLLRTVSLKGVQPQTVLAMCTADQLHIELFGTEAVITSVTDGVHGVSSLHDDGLAFDVRTNDLPTGDDRKFINELRRALGEGHEFDVILEDIGTPNEHGHCEFQPKH